MKRGDCHLLGYSALTLHPDVLADDFSEDIFALDFGPLSDYLIARDLGLSEAETEAGTRGLPGCRQLFSARRF